MDDELIATELEGPSPGRTRQRVLALVAASAFVAAVAAGAVAASGGGGSSRPKLPAGTVAGTPAAEPSLAYPYQAVKYQVAGTLPAIAGSTPAYRLSSVFDRAAAERLVSALGLHGQLIEHGGFWQATDGDRTLTITEAPGLPWFLGRAFAVGGGSGAVTGTATAVAVPPATSICPLPPCAPGHLCPQVCVKPPTPVQPPSRPADLPTRSAAQDLATAIAAKAGFPVADAAVTVQDAFSAWTVDLSPKLGGLPTDGWSMSLDVGPAGAVVGGRGFLAAPAKVGDYPLAGTAIGFQRLQSGATVRPEPVPMLGIAQPACPPNALCQSPPVRTVTISGARLVLEWDGEFLVPAYAFLDASGAVVGTVAAVTDRDLQSISVGPPTTVPGRPAPAPAPVPVPLPAESVPASGAPSSPPASTACGQPAPAGAAVPSSCPQS